MRSWRYRAGRSALLLSLLLFGWPETALAHTIKLDLALWGDFEDAAQCQRAVGRAAAQCITEAVSVRRACHQMEMSGTPCDQAAVDAAVGVARTRALNIVDGACTLEQLNSLGFANVRDCENDVISACRELDVAAESASFGPVSRGGTGGPVSEPIQICVEQAAAAAGKLLRAAFEARLRAFDKIAASDLTLDEKEALLKGSAMRIARTLATLQQHVRARCSDTRFAAIYGRDVSTFLEALARRTDCLVGWTYAQGEILCPAAVCGNGIREPGEACDDGNTLGGDGCSANCSTAG